ncbi:GNAT family N-acetyltransferase [Peribacillus sp. SCS-155]|uniref:GNAT family N-acetyltransferase n=1 Tax=Peribacillus sedimenti TaxID=3115297 RepID=UPI003905CA8E
MEFRKATVKDIDLLIELRKKQLVDEGLNPDSEIDTELYLFFKNKLNDGSLIQWLVEDHAEVVACGAIMFYEFPPSYINKSGKRAYIANMYTNDRYRGQGIATKLLNILVDEAKQTGISNILLVASKLGRPVYKKFGFQEANEWLEFNCV